MTFDLTKISASASFDLRISVQPVNPEGKQQVVINVNKSVTNTTSNPQNESQSETYQYFDTPANNQATIEAALEAGTYLTV